MANAHSRGNAPGRGRVGRGMLLRRLAPMDDAGINDLPGTGDRLEMHLGAGDFDGHETLILVEKSRRFRVRPHVAFPQLAGGARDEIVDAFLRLEPFVDVVVAGEDGGDTGADGSRLEEEAQVDR